MNNQINLTAEEQAKLELVMISSPSLRIAHELKEELITIYNSNITSCSSIFKYNLGRDEPFFNFSYPTRWCNVTVISHIPHFNFYDTY